MWAVYTWSQCACLEQAWVCNISEETRVREVGWLPPSILRLMSVVVPRPRLQTVPGFMQTCQLEFSLHRGPETFLIFVGFKTMADSLSLSNSLIFVLFCYCSYYSLCSISMYLEKEKSFQVCSG